MLTSWFCALLAQRVLPFLGWRILRSNVVAACACSTYAISEAGELFYFGEDQIDVDDLGQVVAAAAGHKHACAIEADGELVCFGDIDAGQCDKLPDGPVMASD